MPIPIVIAAAGTAFSALSGRKSSKEAAARAERIGRLNASYIGQETEEDIRKLELTHEQTMGQAKAAIGASGFQEKGTNVNYLDSLEGQFQSEKDWIKKSGLSRQEIARAGGGNTASNIRDVNKANTIQAVTNIAGFFK